MHVPIIGSLYASIIIRKGLNALPDLEGEALKPHSAQDTLQFIEDEYVKKDKPKGKGKSSSSKGKGKDKSTGKGKREMKGKDSIKGKGKSLYKGAVSPGIAPFPNSTSDNNSGHLTCHFCHVGGHIKPNCRKWLALQQISDQYKQRNSHETKYQLIYDHLEDSVLAPRLCQYCSDSNCDGDNCESPIIC